MRALDDSGGGYSGGSGGGDSGDGGVVDHTGWNVFISGGSDYSLPAGFAASGHHPGDNGPIPDVPMGSQFSGTPLLVGVGANDYSLQNYTWTFPTGALKGYGVFASDLDDGQGGTYTKFDSGPTSSRAQNPYYYNFTANDLNKSGPGDPDIFNTFYFGPRSNTSQPSTVSVTATFVKIVDGTVVDSFTNSDSVEFNVVKPVGNISRLQFGTAGVSSGPYDGADYVNGVNGQYDLGMDKNHLQPTAPEPVGIQYAASIAYPDVGAFTVIQTIVSGESRQWTDTGGVFHNEQRGAYATAGGGWRLTAALPALDSLKGGVGYGFRLNDPTMGDDSAQSAGDYYFYCNRSLNRFTIAIYVIRSKRNCVACLHYDVSVVEETRVFEGWRTASSTGPCEFADRILVSIDVSPMIKRC